MTDKFLFLADFHVKARTWTNNTQVRGDAYEAMKQIGDKAEEHQLDTLVIGGDFFDSNRPTPDDLVQTVDFLSRFKQVYYIRGNHDSCDPSYLESISRILGIDNFVQQLNGQMVHLSGNNYLSGISWMPSREEYRKAVKDTIEWFRDNHKGDRLYLVLHTSFRHLLSFEGAYAFDAEEVGRWCDWNDTSDITLLVGDVHVRNSQCFGSGMLFHSPGSVYPLQFNDADTDKGCTVVDTKGIRLNRFVFMPVAVRRYTSWRYTGEVDTLNAWLDTISRTQRTSEYHLPTYAKIIVENGVDFPRIDMTQYPDLVIQIQLETEEFDPGHAVEGADGVYTLEQAINDEFPDPDVAEIANKLVVSPDPADEIRKYLDFWQVERTVF